MTKLKLNWKIIFFNGFFSGIFQAITGILMYVSGIYFEIEEIEDFYHNIKDQVEVIVPYKNNTYKHFAIKDVNGYILLFGIH